MPIWEVTYADSNSTLLTHRLVTPADLESWSVRPTKGVILVVPREYLAEMLAALPDAVPRPLRTSQADGRQLSTFLRAKAAVRLVASKYERPHLAERGIRTCIATRRFKDWRGLLVVETKPGVADALLRRADLQLPSADAAPGEPAGAGGDWAVREVGDIPVLDVVATSFVGGSPAACEVRRRIMLAARGTHPVLIAGEMGTGKDNVARAIHAAGPRPGGPFVVMNCAAVAQDAVGPGSFGGIRDGAGHVVFERMGLWGAANGGTLYLDEVADLSLAQQAVLVRVLEHGHGLGTLRDHIPANVRIIVASRQRLGRLVRAARFREDLYLTLLPWQIPTPALRNHPEDIPVLAAHFWARLDPQGDRPVPADAWASLCDYAWSGNARELRAFLEEIDFNLFCRAPSAEMIRLALRDWRGRAVSRDYSWVPEENRRLVDR